MSQIKVNSIVPVGGLPAGASGGGIIQIVQTVITDTKSYTANANTYADMPGFNCTITPSSSSNKVMIVVGIGGLHQESGTIAGKILRGSTDIGVGDANGNRPRAGFRMYGSAIYNTNHSGSYHFTFLDTGVSTTSATTYKVQGARYGTSTFKVQDNNTFSEIVLMEIAA